MPQGTQKMVTGESAQKSGRPIHHILLFLATWAHGVSSEVSKRSTVPPVPPEGQRERLIEVRKRALSGLYNHIFCLIPAVQ